MAINRDIVFLTEDGSLVKKSYEAILQMLTNNVSAINGERADLSPESTLGQELQFDATLFNNFAEVVQMIFNTFDLTNARGQLLDMLMLLGSGLTRNTKSFSRAKMNFLIPTGIVSGGAILNATWSFRAINTNNNNLIEQWTAMPLDGSPTVSFVSSAGGYDEYEIVREVTCTTSGAYELNSGSQFLELRIDGQYITDEITSVVGTVAMLGYGSNEETDEQFKTRAQTTFAIGSKTLSESINSSLLTTFPQIVKDTMVINSNDEALLNIGAMTTEDGDKVVEIPLHDILIIVQPQADVSITNAVNGRAIALSLQNKIPVGIRTFVKTGGVLSTVNSYLEFSDLPVGNTNLSGIYESLRFKVATRYNPTITITLKGQTNVVVRNLIEEQIKARVIKYSQSYLIGQRIDDYELANVIQDVSVPRRYTVEDVSVSGDVKYGYWLAKADTTFTFAWAV